ncbi:hypothetical protein [Ornithinimicrobium cryptoxanthini]|uniref:Uncharacterized protein n=1 Tax=Ornithinimicrobium cryptoxanthini TaxID=2934161 RepID=A0ABY4YFV9_9MICO|nr:hypothetical protein [Ornithinimicrobium cryptoxanthini]USQ75658.1 hypothetical protein NF557_13710 [Ornithinimicrobium cryptoxanthini]
MTASMLHMSLADVARLAGVARPVASVWRSRPASGHPFPAPVARVAGHDRFDAFEVVDYLAVTGRGNATVERADVAAHAQLAQVGGLAEETMFAGLTALLVLGAERGEALADLTDGRLLEVAEEADPHDELLYREIAALGPHLSELAAHADALADASYSARAAFELLLAQQLARGGGGLAAVQLRPQVSTLVGRLAAELAADAGWEAPLFVGPVAGVGDLLLQAAKQYAGGLAPSVAVAPDDTSVGRLRRRRLRVHDLHQVAVAHTDAGDLRLPEAPFDGSVHVMQLAAVHHADGSGMGSSDTQVLDAVGDLVIQLAPDSRVVVVGPASALTDRPTSAETDRARDAVLRSGRLRAAIRLPSGLLVRAPRQHLALWVLGPAHPDVPVMDRWTVVGDLSTAALDASTSDDLITDVLASLVDPRQVEHHAYRFGHRVVTATLIPGHVPLVDTRSPVLSTGRGRRTLDDVIARRECRLISGNRVDSAHLQATGRAVIGPEELTGSLPTGSRAVDPLTFPTAYPSSRDTEPGDVIFCTSPRPSARVDREGGTVVLAPARTLRVMADPDEGMPDLVPEVIAADINQAAGNDWRRWRIRLVPPERQAPLREELHRIESERRDILDQLTQLEQQADQAIAHATAPREEGR